ncbi:MAG: hypothetical protein FWG36_10410 [Oscillospiraceae bacterium]|nr:hypothetical protein [Oscillospiraceae bacterium]
MKNIIEKVNRRANYLVLAAVSLTLAGIAFSLSVTYGLIVSGILVVIGAVFLIVQLRKLIKLKKIYKENELKIEKSRVLYRNIKPSSVGGFGEYIEDDFEDDFVADTPPVELVVKPEKAYDEYKDKLTEAVDRNTPTGDIISRMLRDTEETTEYFTISKNESKKSLNVSIAFTGLGFSMIVFAVVWGIVSNNIAPAVVASVGGTVTDIIGATAFVIRKQSLEQLNRYFDKLRRNQDILLTVKLAGELPPKERDEIYKEIIRKVLSNISD